MRYVAPVSRLSGRIFASGVGFLLFFVLISSFLGCGGSGSNNTSAPPAELEQPFAADEFTIVALPDTQYYSRDFPDIFRAQTQWIADHIQDQHIQLVLGLGDIVDDGADPVQWQNAEDAVSLIQGKLPYMMAIGNHDYDLAHPAGRTASAQGFNAHYGPARYAGASWYRGSFPAGSNENFYGVVNINGRNFLILVLEFAPRDIALAWADGILKANQDKEAIVVTHAFTFTDNTRMSRCDANSASSFGVGQDNDGDDVWWKLLRNYPNVRMVLSGHVNTGDGTGHRMDLGAGGNLVNQMLSDYQSESLGGGGYLRLIRVSASLNRVSVITYSPYSNSVKSDDHNQFAVPYVASSGTGTGTVAGFVKDAVTCAPVPGVAVGFSGGSAITDATGAFSMPAVAAFSFPVTATLNGWASNARWATSTTDSSSQPSPTKIFVSAAGAVSGFVRSSTGSPIARATLIFNGGDLRFPRTLQTDGSGFYNSGPIAIGKYSISVAASGHSSTTSSASITAGATTTLNINLP
jgi:carboxypeptidase family protein/calcineurin-like phosphoesterase family protein